MRRYIVTALCVYALTVSGCSAKHAQSASSSDEPKQTEKTTSEITCEKSISIQEGNSVEFKDYCKVDGKKTSDLIYSPSVYKPKATGKTTVDVTITDKDNNMYVQTFTVSITPKPTPTPEPTVEPTPEPEEEKPVSRPQTSNKNSYSGSSSSSSKTPAYVAPQPAAPAEPDPTPDNDVISSGNTGGGGAAAGSAYADVGSCDAAADPTRSHRCTWNGSQYVLTYN